LPSTCALFFSFATAAFVLLICLFHWTENKINIYVGLTDMQRKWYWSILEKDINAVKGKYDCYFFLWRHLIIFTAGLTGKKEGKTHLMNMVMQVSSCPQLFSSADPVSVQLWKVTCHPYLLDGAVHLVLSWSMTLCLILYFRNLAHLIWPKNTSSKTWATWSSSVSSTEVLQWQSEYQWGSLWGRHELVVALIVGRERLNDHTSEP